jgi:hypothetical protein
MAPNKFATSSGSKKNELGYVHVLKKKKNPSKSLVREPSVLPQQGVHGKRCTIFRANGLFIHS